MYKVRKNELTTFGKWVKIRLVEENMTQTELGKRLGVSKSSVTKMIYGEQTVANYQEAIIDLLTKDDQKAS